VFNLIATFPLPSFFGFQGLPFHACFVFSNVFVLSANCEKKTPWIWGFKNDMEKKFTFSIIINESCIL